MMISKIFKSLSIFEVQVRPTNETTESPITSTSDLELPWFDETDTVLHSLTT